MVSKTVRFCSIQNGRAIRVYMQGDILLFFATKSWTDQIIAHFTNGPYCHVEVDMGDGTSIGALWSGIARHPIPAENLFSRVPVQAESAEQLNDGLTFIAAQVGRKYGVVDIFNQALKALRIRLFIGVPAEYDCSDLAARFIAMCDGPIYRGLGTLGQEPHLVTPNDLARACSLIK